MTCFTHGKEPRSATHRPDARPPRSGDRGATEVHRRCVEAAEKDGRDLSRAGARAASPAPATGIRNGQRPDRAAEGGRRIATSRRKRMAEISQALRRAHATTEAAKTMEYRSAAGQYVLDYWRPGSAARTPANGSSCTTGPPPTRRPGTTPACCPQQILQPVLNWVDESRPMANALGIRQSAVRLLVATEGQPARRRRPAVRGEDRARQPQDGDRNGARHRHDLWRLRERIAPKHRLDAAAILDLVINDLAGVYAQETEQALCAAIDAATTAGPVLPTGAATPAQVNAAIWTAVGSVYAATKGAGRVIIAASPDTLGLLGPAFPPINPQNAVSSSVSAPVTSPPAAPEASAACPWSCPPASTPER